MNATTPDLEGRQPYYWLENFNLSSPQFGMMPTNPWRGHWCPPTHVTGNHLNMFEEPQVQDLAEELRTCLESGSPPAGSPT